MFKLQATHAQTAGADAIACVGPTFFKPDSLGLSPTVLKLYILRCLFGVLVLPQLILSHSVM